MKKIICMTLAAVMAAVLFVGCGTASSTVSTDGSTSMEKVIGTLGESFMNNNKGITFTYNPTGSGSGITAVAEGRCDIGLSSRSLKAEKKEQGLVDQRTTLIADCEAVKTMLADNADIETERERISKEQQTVEALVDTFIRDNAAKPMDQNEYNARYDGYQMEHDALNGKLEKLGRKKEKRQQQIDVLDRFIADLKEMRDMPVEFSGSLWNAFVEKLTIYPDGNAEFLFKNGAAITEEL